MSTVLDEIVIFWNFEFWSKSGFWPKVLILVNILAGENDVKVMASNDNESVNEKFEFLINISIFDQNINFWPKYQFLTKISIFDQNCHFLPNLNFGPRFQFLTKISIFCLISTLEKSFNFFQISIFDQTFKLWKKFKILTKISNYDKNSKFWRNFQF